MNTQELASLKTCLSCFHENLKCSFFFFLSLLVSFFSLQNAGQSSEHMKEEEKDKLRNQEG